MSSDALILLRQCDDRVLEREGIPMVLALVSEVGPMPTADDAARADGARIAGSMDELCEALMPSGRDRDLGRIMIVAQAAAYADFGGAGGQL